MVDPIDGPPPTPPSFVDRIARLAHRRIAARHNAGKGVWFGLGMMGLIGWSIVVPTLLGAMAGQWLDSQHLDQRSWTLALLIAGLVLGCWNAWRWVSVQDRAMREDRDNDK